MSEEVKYDSIAEEIPFGVDLDTLLGDSFIDNTPNIDLPEDEDEVTFPHFKVSTKKFMDALKISGVISQSSGRDIVSRSVGMSVENGNLQIFVTDFEIFAKKEITLINTENILEDYIAINLPVIAKLIKACPPILTIYKNENKYFIRLMGGDFELETINVGKDQLAMTKDLEKLKEEGTLDRLEFCKVIKNLFVIASIAVAPEQRRIFFKGNDISATFLYCSARYKSEKLVPEFDLTIRSIKILYILALGTDSPELIVSKFKNKIMISGDNFSFNFVKSAEFKPSQQMIDAMGVVLSGELLNIKAGQLNTLAELATGLVYSLARMEFNYTEEGKIEFIMKTKRTDGKFTLISEGEVNIKPFEKSVSVQSGLLKSLLGVFSQQPVISMTLNSNGIGLSWGNYDAVLYTENSTSISQ